jgi:hypothetical protein
MRAPVASSPSSVELRAPCLAPAACSSSATPPPGRRPLRRRLGVAHRVLDAVLLLLELDLGGRADLDDGDAAGQLGEALLELLAVVVGVGVLDLGADLVDAALISVGVAGTLDDGGLVLGDDDLAGRPSRSRVMFSSLRPTSSEMTWPPVRIAMSCSMALRRSPKPGALTATDLNVPRILLTTRVARASPSTSSAMITQRLAGLHDLLEHGQQVLDREILRVDDEDVRVVEDGFHALGVGDEVRRDVALVEAHALGELELHAEGVGLLDGDDAVLADLVDGLGDHLADLLVGGGDEATWRSAPWSRPPWPCSA